MNLLDNMTFCKALTLPFRITPMAAIVGIIDRLLGIVIAPISIIITSYFIDTAINVITEEQDVRRVILPLIVMVFFSIYGYITSPLLGLINQRAAMKTYRILREQFIAKRVGLEYKHIESMETMDLINRVWSDPERRISEILSNLLNCFSTIGITVSFVVILFTYAPIIGSIVFALSVPAFFIALKAGKATYQAYRETTVDRRFSWSFYWVLTARETTAERNMFNYSQYMGDKYMYHFEKDRKHRLKTNRLWFIRSKSTAMITGALSIVSMILLAPSVASRSLSVGMFIALQGVLFSSVQMISVNLPNHYKVYIKQREFIKELNAFFNLSKISGAEALPAQPPEFKKLEFRNVSFVYPGTKKIILDKLSFTIEKGMQYSFVGVNGAGKTTIIKLITRLYDDYTGEILLNGKTLRDWPLEKIKACFCVLFQDFARYDITVAENVAIGKINNATKAEIDNALNVSGFMQCAEELMNGTETLLGKTHEYGVDLSSGQWQRLAFARAIINPAPVKILDEPTAALDPIAESHVYAQFKSISAGSTTIFISHRLASAKLADTIFVLNNGRLEEIGNHDQLLAAQGVYAEMYTSQQSWYK